MYGILVSEFHQSDMINKALLYDTLTSSTSQSHVPKHLNYQLRSNAQHYCRQSKAAAKSAGLRYQWQIMQSLGLTDDEIRPFAEPAHWLGYFPPHCKQDLTGLGLKVSQCGCVFVLIGGGV